MKNRIAGVVAAPVQAIVLLALLTVMGLWPAAAAAVQPERQGQESFLTRAVYAEGSLWVLSDAGNVSFLTEGQDKRVE